MVAKNGAKVAKNGTSTLHISEMLLENVIEELLKLSVKAERVNRLGGDVPG